MIQIIYLLLLAPAGVAMGYELVQYYNGENPALDFSALGFLWTEYHPQSFEYISNLLGPDIWGIINPILTYPAVYVGLAFAAIGIAIVKLVQLAFGRKREKHRYSAQRKWNRGA